MVKTYEVQVGAEGIPAVKAELDRLRDQNAKLMVFAKAHKEWLNRIPALRVIEVLSDKDGDEMLRLESLLDQAMRD